MPIVIPIPGLSPSDPVPGNYLVVKFAQGVAGAGTTDYSAVLIGNALSGSLASVTAGQRVYSAVSDDQLVTEADAISLFGSGSELHLMFREFRKRNVNSSLYAIAVDEGVSAVAATGTITLTGTATTPATARAFICDTLVEVGISIGDTATIVALAMRDAINSQTFLPVTASVASGVLTLLSKNRGPRGNELRFSAKMFPSTGTGLAITPGIRTTLSGGSVADDNTTALVTLSTSRYYYYISAANDSANLGRVSSQITSMGVATVGLRQRAVTGWSGSSVSAAQAVAVAQNNPRVEIVFQQESDLGQARLAAAACSVYTLQEQALGADYSMNFNGFGKDATTGAIWQIPGALSGVKMARTQIVSALNNGITPIATTTVGSTYLVRRITTYSLNGASPDYRVRDACKVTVADRFGDDLISQFDTRFPGKNVGNDPLPGQPIPASNVVTPRMVKSCINDLVNEYGGVGGGPALLEGIDVTKASTQVVREASAPTRISCRIPIKVSDILCQVATELNEVSVG